MFPWVLCVASKQAWTNMTRMPLKIRSVPFRSFKFQFCFDHQIQCICMSMIRPIQANCKLSHFLPYVLMKPFCMDHFWLDSLIRISPMPVLKVDGYLRSRVIIISISFSFLKPSGLLSIRNYSELLTTLYSSESSKSSDSSLQPRWWWC